MNKASISMLISGIYAGVLGVFFLFFPEIILIIIGLSTPPDVISRVAGMIFLIFSYIYIRTSLKDGLEFFYLITAQERFTVPIFLTIFYILGWANWILVVFGFVDLGFGLCTFIALKIDKKNNKKS
jgi:hypothetical protein